ncbi:30S ribosomal protein S6e [Candidatus Woesearchaeota archaeon CG_4_10_14_0_2_um_filter_33_13]|nr:MAG: 30S ribosomal protein S6e [Candidatus Woesearchaeota archaeon CG_4_10_14_0_2_um_filter_33_13]
MVNLKIVIGAKDGKSYQRELTEQETDFLHKKRIGDKFSGDQIGYSGYEFLLTGGSDKCGFPMRKGIQQPRKKIAVVGRTVGFNGKNRNNKKQNGLMTKKTVCGELVTKIIHQVNLKVVKEGSQPLGGEAVEKKE